MDQKNNDIFRNLKYIGYCWSNLPPDGADVDIEDFVRHCKFHLCKASNRLMKDPIWDSYIDEDIIAEYYAHVFSTSQEEAEKFLQSLQGLNSDIYDWLDEQIANNQKALDQKADELEDSIEFIPDSLGD